MISIRNRCGVSTYLLTGTTVSAAAVAGCPAGMKPRRIRMSSRRSAQNDSFDIVSSSGDKYTTAWVLTRRRSDRPTGQRDDWHAVMD